MRFGVNTWFWVWHFTTEDIRLIERVAKLGFDWIEIPVESREQPIDFRRVGATIRDHGLGVSVCALFGPGCDLTRVGDQDQSRAGIEYAKHCVDAAALMGGSRVCGPLYAPICRLWQADSDQRKRELDWTARKLNEIGRYAEDRAVVIGLEALNRYETSFVNITDQLLDLVAMADSPAIQCMADTYHMSIEEKDVGQAIERMGRRLVHIHSNENDRGVPGSGHVDWVGVGRALKTIGFQGALVMESFDFGNRDLAQAAWVWRSLVSSEEGLVEGLRFLKNLTR
jgi:D-psicose/D-tagatose/L-ribulose 3-epimerase